ncbi:MAG: NYN domain-containing protein [Minisyncoccia bacterium]
MEKSKKPTYLFIDGTNLYAAQYELFGPKRYLNFGKFIDKIEEKIGVKFDKIYFYASYSPKPKRPTRKEKLYLKNEALFYRSVRKTPKVVFFKGYRSKTSGKEKEVDVKLAVDIVHFAHLRKYDLVYLLSGDADFMHALKIAEILKRKIFILAIENRIPNRLSFHYRTYVVVFRGKFKGKIFPKQKIKFLFADRKELIGEVK